MVEAAAIRSAAPWRRYRVTHTTRYRFDDWVTACSGEVRIRPRTLDDQRCDFHQLVFRPYTTGKSEDADEFGNGVSAFEIGSRMMTLEITGNNVVRRRAPAWPEPDAAPTVATARQSIVEGATGAGAFLAFDRRTRANGEMAGLARQLLPDERSLGAALPDLAAYIFEKFRYDPAATTVEDTAESCFQLGAGVCQDFAHLAVALCRSRGLAARYVSGYLDTSRMRGPERVIGGDASHAWVSVLVPGLGWLDIDPTLGRIADDGHIVVAWGRDYGDISPVRGRFDGGRVIRLEVSVDVSPEEAPPR